MPWNLYHIRDHINTVLCGTGHGNDSEALPELNDPRILIRGVRRLLDYQATLPLSEGGGGHVQSAAYDMSIALGKCSIRYSRVWGVKKARRSALTLLHIALDN